MAYKREKSGRRRRVVADGVNQEEERRAREIEEALRLQREKAKASAKKSEEESSQQAGGTVMRGFLYDAATDRYYRSNRRGSSTSSISSSIASRPPEASEASPVDVKSTGEEFGSGNIATLLQQNLLYDGSSARDRLPLYYASTRIRLSHLKLEPLPIMTSGRIEDCSFHPLGGTVYITAKKIVWNVGNTKALLHVDGPPLDSPFQNIRVCWNPLLDTPLFAIVQSNVSQIRVKLYSTNGGNESRHYLHEGASFELTIKESIHGISWSPLGVLIFALESGAIHRLDISTGRTSTTFSNKGCVEVLTSLRGSASCCLLGQRNGIIKLYDSRTREKPVLLTSMTYCIDHMYSMRDENQYIVQDICNTIKLFDIRSASFHSVIREEAKSPMVRRKRFWVSPDERCLFTPSVTPSVDAEGSCRGIDVHTLASPAIILCSLQNQIIVQKVCGNWEGSMDQVDYSFIDWTSFRFACSFFIFYCHEHLWCAW